MRNKRITELFNKQSGVCGYCRVDMTLKLGYSNTSTLDHIIPRSRQGTSHYYNLIAVCYKCNQEKADKPLHEFLSRRLG